MSGKSVTTLSKDQLAQLLDLTRQRIDQLAKEGIVHRAGRGIFKADSVPSYINYLRKQLEARDHTEAASEARLRKESAIADFRERQAEKARYELEELRGNLIPLDAAEEVRARYFDRLVTALDNLPGKIAPKLVGLRSVTKVQVALRDAIDGFKPTLGSVIDDDDVWDVEDQVA